MRVRLAILMLAVLILAGCGQTTIPAMYGLSWQSIDLSEGTNEVSALSSAAEVQVQPMASDVSLENGTTASGYWIPDSDDPMGISVRIYAWRNVGGVQEPVEAVWAIEPEEGASLEATIGTETSVRPIEPGEFQVIAAIEDHVLTMDVTIYPGFVLESREHAMAHHGGRGFRFDLERYTDDPNEADIFIDDDGVIHVPGGYTPATGQYLHEAIEPVGESTYTTFGPYRLVGMIILTTRTGEKVAVHHGLTVGSSLGHGNVFGYRKF